MTLDTAKAIADYLYKNLQKKIELKIIPNDKKGGIYFFGGEPTLCYDSIIVPLVNYCKEKYPGIFTFGITTNGTLLNKEKIDFFKENNFDILLSIDGAKETQDYNRPCKNCNLSSFDLLEKNIPYLLEKFPNICFRSTIYAPTAKYLFENYLYAESLGFKRWEAVQDDRHIWSEKEKEELANEFSKIYLYRNYQISNNIIPMHIWRQEYWLSLTLDLLNKDSNRFAIENNLSVKRCGLGTFSGSIGWDGNIYGCQEQPSKDKKNIFLIGNIFQDGIDTEKHKQLLEFYYNSQKAQIQKYNKCKYCLLNPLCKINEQICPSVTYDLFNDMTSITDINCFLKQVYVKNSILQIEFLNQLKNKQKEQI